MNTSSLFGIGTHNNPMTTAGVTLLEKLVLERLGFIGKCGLVERLSLLKITRAEVGNM
jgi:hypothetical protein